MTEADQRVGFGVDVHALSPGTGPIRLCGVAIDAPYLIEATSDGDVGLHALIDAMLGAAALGDIGVLFPSSDSTWEGADSRSMTTIAFERLGDAGYEVRNVDVTLVVQAVRVAPYRAEMQRAIAELLAVPAASVSVKATTTDGLGLIGRAEGVAALAVAVVGPSRQP